ncbi:MAG: hypothetical protein FWE37_02380 [Spirochaetaceae bacterium]|nr:hypothetical protein [Spirochaetaceae bacterium]
MKNGYLKYGVLVLALIMALVSCSGGSGKNSSGNGSNNEPPPPRPLQPRISIDNSANRFPVTLFYSPERDDSSRIGSARVRGSSWLIPLDFISGSQMVTFYPRYTVTVEGRDFYVDPTSGHPELLINGNSSTTIPVVLRELSSLMASDEILTDNIYLQLTNNDRSAAIRLTRGGATISAINGEAILNPNITALFNVMAGNAANYRIIAGGQEFTLPNNITFEPGHFYTMQFTDGGIDHVRTTPITLDGSAAIGSYL